MPNYIPIPGQQGGGSTIDLPADDLTRRASERAGALLIPYEQQFGLKPLPGGAAPGGSLAPAPSMAAGPTSEDRLYQAIHPETFSRIMDAIMTMVTGRAGGDKPIPRQYGGDTNPSRAYLVGEVGPELFVPNQSGEILPTNELPFGYGRSRELEAQAQSAQRQPGPRSYNERISSYGSPGWFGSEKSIAGGQSYSMLTPPQAQPQSSTGQVDVIPRAEGGLVEPPEERPLRIPWLGMEEQGVTGPGEVIRNVGRTGLGTAEYLGLGLGYPLARGKEMIESGLGIEPIRTGMTSQRIRERMGELLPGGPQSPINLRTIGYRRQPGESIPIPGSTENLPRQNALDRTGGDFDLPGPGALRGGAPVPAGYTDPEGWQDYGEGIRYRVGETGAPIRVPVVQNPEELELASRRRWEIPGYAERAYPGAVAVQPGYQRSYWEAHPEEKAAQDMYDMLRGPSPSSYEAGVERMQEMNLQDIANNRYATKEARAGAVQRLAGLRAGRTTREEQAGRAAGEAYRYGMEYAPGSPASQERLAHADYYRRMPEIGLTQERERTAGQLAGIQTEVAGRLEAAKIAAEVKDPLMKEIGAIISLSEKNAALGMPSDPMESIGTILRIAKAMGNITPEQWAKLPPEYTGEKKTWTEKSLRQDLKANGMGNKEIEAYIKRARAAGKF